MPLQVAPTNPPLTVAKIFADDKVKSHLENLGITLGSQLTLLSSENKGVVVLVKGVRLAIDGNTAGKIFVK